jgi:hypothetical protein
MKSLLGWLRGAPRARDRASPAPFPFTLRPLAEPDEAVAALFRRAFGGEPPREPFHFAAYRNAGGELAGYVHYIEYRPGVFLCGGLCVDASVYRRLSAVDRARASKAGSLSRWLLARSIEALPRKQAVFAFTGSAQSRRDVLALGFEVAVAPHLFAQWHACGLEARPGHLAEVVAVGPF